MPCFRQFLVVHFMMSDVGGYTICATVSLTLEICYVVLRKLHTYFVLFHPSPLQSRPSVEGRYRGYLYDCRFQGQMLDILPAQACDNVSPVVWDVSCTRYTIITHIFSMISSGNLTANVFQIFRCVIMVLKKNIGTGYQFIFEQAEGSLVNIFLIRVSHTNIIHIPTQPLNGICLTCTGYLKATIHLISLMACVSAWLCTIQPCNRHISIFTAEYSIYP